MSLNRSLFGFFKKIIIADQRLWVCIRQWLSLNLWTLISSWWGDTYLRSNWIHQVTCHVPSRVESSLLLKLYSLTWLMTIVQYYRLIRVGSYDIQAGLLSVSTAVLSFLLTPCTFKLCSYLFFLKKTKQQKQKTLLIVVLLMAFI